MVQASPGLIQRYLKLNSIGSGIHAIGGYTLGAVIIGCATYLAATGVIEGQAIAGFLGAAIGYVFARTAGGD